MTKVDSIFPNIEPNKEDLERYKNLRGLYIEDDWERVKCIFKRDDYGKPHPLLVEVLQNSQFGLFGGSAFGGILRSVYESKEFLRNNDTKIYLNKSDVQKHYSTHSFKAMIKGMFEWGPRIMILFGSYTFFTNCFALYRNKSGILENTFGGFAACGLLRSHFGIRGIISGGFVGAIGGTIYGTIKWALLKIVGIEEIELQYAQFAYMKFREEQTSLTQKQFDEVYKIQEAKSNLHEQDPLK